ncbi:MAG: Maf family protein [Anaerolineales bacterium]
MTVEFILASQSPRRQTLFGLIQKPFFVMAADVDETRQGGESPAEYVIRLAKMKAEDVEEKVAKITTRPVVILAADTTVVDGGEILGKPSHPAQAREILERLRGSTHSVFSGVAVRKPGDELTLTDLVRTEVTMREYSDKEIEAYIKSGDPFDKAGAYAIQNDDFQPVASWDGCFANVMGLPLCHVERLLAKLGVSLSAQVPVQCQGAFGYDCQIPQIIDSADYVS